jgi:hypothetical protein
MELEIASFEMGAPLWLSAEAPSCFRWRPVGRVSPQLIRPDRRALIKTAVTWATAAQAVIQQPEPPRDPRGRETDGAGLQAKAAQSGRGADEAFMADDPGPLLERVARYPE